MPTTESGPEPPNPPTSVDTPPVPSESSQDAPGASQVSPKQAQADEAERKMFKKLGVRPPQRLR